jgi:uncharacterized protein YndB with AHSA1/START domain
VSPEQIAKVHRVLRAPPEVVFDEWLDPVGMTEWMCPRPARAVKIALDPVPGGVLRIDVSDSGMLFYVTGQFVELDRPRLLRFTWSCSDWADPTVQSLVTVGLEPRGAAQTLMTITSCYRHSRRTAIPPAGPPSPGSSPRRSPRGFRT